MSTTKTLRMLRAYLQRPLPTSFFSGFYQSPRQNFFASESVEIDISRSGDAVAVVIPSITGGYRYNEKSLFTNKEFTPPIFQEAMALNSTDLLKRQIGETPYKDPKYRAALINMVFSNMRVIEAKIRRANELQASQVMQTGTITFKDSNGVNLFTLDYSPKTSHFPTASISWATATGKQKMDDIQALAEQNVKDGKAQQNQLIFGVSAYNNFINDSAVQALLDNRRMDVGQISPMSVRGDGGIFRGRFGIGNQEYDVWTYEGYYDDVETGVNTPYMHPGKVIVRASTGRMDAVFGDIPNIGRILGVNGPQLLPELPRRMSNAVGGMDMHVNAWTSNDGTQLFSGVGSRPLYIPVAIDTFGCLNTQLT